MNSLTDVSFALSLASIFISIIGAIAGCLGLVYVIGLRNSTHKIEWVPFDTTTGKRVDPQYLDKEFTDEQTNEDDYQ